ncbi:MAG: hypothetical protein QOK30_599 [Nocardioidaceae bacterium]|jgi:low temperature requirement protein LtrA|nr:hypothetical protein [Nocardioidaceae bacterium]
MTGTMVDLPVAAPDNVDAYCPREHFPGCTAGSTVGVWCTWLNGTLYHDLHGSDDGRSRIYMFVRMSLIALISGYAGGAAYDAGDGRRFAVLLAVLLVWLTYQWWVVRRQDDPRTAAVSTPYFIGLGVIWALVVASIAVEDETIRAPLWAVGSAAAIVVPLAGGAWGSERRSMSFRVSESMAERFALFTIIVLGEAVVGVVDGLTEADAGWATKGVGLLCLCIGFGIWWNYFDFVGRRPPRAGVCVRGLWLVMHLPLSMSVAATGAGMVSLIEHARDHQTRAGTAWLIGGSMAVLCGSLSVIVALVPQRLGAKLVGYSPGLPHSPHSSRQPCTLGPGCSRPFWSHCSAACGSRRSSGMRT